MKRTTIALLALMPTLLFGQHVQDDAGLLTKDESASLQDTLRTSKVYVQTLQTPQGNLLTYANTVIKVFGDAPHFFIVVSMEPKQWRISQWPLGYTNEATVQAAGDALVSQFKLGHFKAGFLAAAVVLDPDVAAQQGSDESLIWVTIFCVIVVGATGIYVLHHSRKKPKVKPATPESLASLQGSLVVTRAATVAAPRPAPALSDSQQVESKDVFHKYTRSQRQRIAAQYSSSSYYTPNCFDDPYMFYNLLLMQDALDEHRGANVTVVEPTVTNTVYVTPDAPQAHWTEPPPPPPQPDRTYNAQDDSSSSSLPSIDFGPSSSSSDLSGSSGSWDSGSGSSDSGSSGSSDSSGAGGSW